VKTREQEEEEEEEEEEIEEKKTRTGNNFKSTKQDFGANRDRDKP